MPMPDRIIVDVDGTLYDTKPVFVRQFSARHGITIADGEITEWNFWKYHITLEEFLALIAEGLHSAEEIGAAKLYPAVAATLRAWRRAGSQIFIASDRAEAAGEHTRRWLTTNGLPVDDLVCAPGLDKIDYAQRVGAGLIIDDKPDTITAALDAGLAVATIIHPYNRNEAALPGVTAAADWAELRRALKARFSVG